jgi:uncharacterized membrane protein YvlD (DUF360 family)
MTNKINPFILKAVPIVGWMIIIAGFFIRIENNLLYAAWLLIFFACAVIHPIQLIYSIPLGKRAGLGYFTIIINTVLFGAAWWMPLKHAATIEQS